jgi:DNA-binding beta-propeller fold protein YncE
VVALVLLGFPLVGRVAAPPPPRALSLAGDYGSLPLSFEPNRGQSGAAVRFLASGPGYGLFLSGDGAVLSLGSRGSLLSMKLLGAAADPGISGLGRLPGEANYIAPGSSQAELGIPTYAGVRYAGVWPGIAMRFYGSQRRLEYDFDLAPGARASEIGVRFAARGGLALAADGALVLQLGGATVRQPQPRAYQRIGGARHAVAAHYMLRGHGAVGIVLGAYDHRRPLTIDPRLIYSTYLDRGIQGPAYAIAVDAAGSAYVAGATSSPRFPTSRHALQGKLPARGGQGATFVTKLAPDGRSIVYSTYLGARGGSYAAAIAVDNKGAAYVGGFAYPHGMPTTPNAFQPEDVGPSESGFVAKLSPSGRHLDYSTYLGGSDEAGGNIGAIAVDGAGHAYVTGDTESEDFPVTPGAAEQRGDVPGFIEPTGFVAKLNRSGSRLLYSTFLGGSLWDTPGGIAIDKAGNAYVAGDTESQDFPVTPGAFQQVNKDDPEFKSAFVTKLNPTGTRFLYSTYLGGSLSDEAKAIAVDRAGDAYVTGDAGPNFPTTAGAFQRKLKGYDSAFVAVLSPDGGRLLHSTLLGRETLGRGIAIDRAGNAFVVGFRAGKEINEVSRGYRGFLAELDPSEQRLLSWTKLGGDRARVAAVALDRHGDVYAAGGSGPKLKTRNPLPQGRPPVPANFPSAFVTKLQP